MGERFKTGYLGDRVSFSDIGRQAGAEIANSLSEIQEKRKQRQLELDTRMGFTKAQQANLPAGLSARYNSMGQLLLNDMQEKAAVAYSTGRADDVQAYQAAKQEYVDLINIGTAVSSSEKSIMDNVAIGNFQNAAATVPEIQAEYRVHDSGVAVQLADGTFAYQDPVTGEQTPWRSSALNDTRGAYAPPIKFEGSEYLVAPLADTMYTENFSNSEGIYQIKFEGTDFQTGELDLNKLYGDVARVLDKKNVAHPNEMGQAISIYGYKMNDAPNKRELTQQDVLDAAQIYPPEAYMPGATFLEGKFNEEGEYVFNVDIEQFNNRPTEFSEQQFAQIRAAREAKATYYEGIAGTIAERISRDNEAGKYAAELEEEANALAEAMREANSESAEDQAAYFAQAPALLRTDGSNGENQFVMPTLADSRYQVTMEGRGLSIEEIIFNSQGQEIAYKVSATKSRQESIDALLNGGMDQAQAEEIVRNWFKKYDNTFIDLATRDTEFLRIKTGLNNGLFESGNKPKSETQRLLARQKIEEFNKQVGVIDENRLTSFLQQSGMTIPELAADPDPATTADADAGTSGPTTASTTEDAPPAEDPAPAASDSTVTAPAPAPAATDTTAAPPDLTNLDVPEPSEPASAPPATEETADAYNTFFNVLDQLGDVNEDALESVQDYYEGLDEEAQSEMEVQVARMSASGLLPTISEGRLTFVRPENF